MANTIYWGQAAVNNTIGFGQGAKIGGSSFSNTKSIELDGIDDYVNVGSSSLGITSAISVSAWVKIPTSNTGGGGTNIQMIVCEDTTSGGQRNWLLSWRGTGYNYFSFSIWHTNLTKYFNQ